MSQAPLTVIFAAGGTGGHVFPALAIAGELKKSRPEARIVFVGTSRTIEARVVPKHGYEFATIWISGFHRSLKPAHLLFPLKVVVACVQSFFLIRRFKPQAVIGTGGYVSGPVLASASILGVPVFIHESNSYPGVTTRLLASRATRIFLAFDEARRWLNTRSPVELVGTPTSEALTAGSKDEAARILGLDPAKQIVLVTGGSQGSRSLNRAVEATLPTLDESIQVLWQTGSVHYEAVRKTVAEREGLWIGPFIERMDLAYVAADVVVCRAGATTIAELTRAGKPAILVPFPYAAEDHQTHNARSLADAGAAILIPDIDVSARLPGELGSLLKDAEKRRRMAEASRRLGRPEAARVIVSRILSLAEGSASSKTLQS